MKHVHKVQRVVLGKGKKEGYEVYRCVNNCTSYFPLALIVGLVVQCWACLSEFEFTKRNLRQVKPKCRACSGRKEVEPEKEKVKEATDNILERLGLK